MGTRYSAQPGRRGRAGCGFVVVFGTGRGGTMSDNGRRTHGCGRTPPNVFASTWLDRSRSVSSSIVTPGP